MEVESPIGYIPEGTCAETEEGVLGYPFTSRINSKETFQFVGKLETPLTVVKGFELRVSGEKPITIKEGQTLTKLRFGNPATATLWRIE